MKNKVMAITALMGIFAGLVLAASTASSAEPAPKCAGDKAATKVTVGIAEMLGCWTDVTLDGTSYKAADFDSQPTYGQGSYQVKGVDLNGFIVASPTSGNRLLVNPKTNTVQSVSAANSRAAEVHLYSIGYPLAGNPVSMGSPFTINFTAPNSGAMLLEDLRLGANQVYTGTLDGFSPVGDVETPIKLLEEGKGSMDLTIRLAGIFALKGRPQSVTILIPSAIGEGSKVDGFELKLEEIDGIKLIKINDFEAKYSAEEKTLGGGADFSLPFMGGKGVSFDFEVQNTILTKATVGASGIKVPIGAPPAGFITALNGGFGFKQAGPEFVLNLNAGATAEFGPEVPTPWGKVVPLEVNSALKIGKEGQDFYFLFDGGIKVFRLNVGSVYLKIHTNSGVQFGFSVGIGFPSYSNNPNDPFYIGSSVDGWVAKQKFQFEGKGKVRLIGLDIFDGRILINDKAAGACWKVTFFDGGAVYEYGAKEAKTFGVSCGHPERSRSGLGRPSAQVGHRQPRGGAERPRPGRCPEIQADLGRRPQLRGPPGQGRGQDQALHDRGRPEERGHPCGGRQPPERELDDHPVRRFGPHHGGEDRQGLAAGEGPGQDRRQGTEAHPALGLPGQPAYEDRLLRGDEGRFRAADPRHGQGPGPLHLQGHQRDPLRQAPPEGGGAPWRHAPGGDRRGPLHREASVPPPGPAPGPGLAERLRGDSGMEGRPRSPWLCRRDRREEEGQEDQLLPEGGRAEEAPHRHSLASGRQLGRRRCPGAECRRSARSRRLEALPSGSAEVGQPRQGRPPECPLGGQDRRQGEGADDLPGQRPLPDADQADARQEDHRRHGLPAGARHLPVRRGGTELEGDAQAPGERRSEEPEGGGAPAPNRHEGTRRFHLIARLNRGHPRAQDWRSLTASRKTSVWRSTSCSVVAGDISAMLWKGVINTPRLRACTWR